MRRRLLPIVFAICQLLLFDIGHGYIVSNAIESELPPMPSYMQRLLRYERPELMEDQRRVVDRLKSYFRWPSQFGGVQNQHVPVYAAEGVGEVFVSGEDISAGGLTEVEGSVPISGNVAFGGPIRASGTVTIAGKSSPATGFSPLPIAPPAGSVQSPTLELIFPTSVPRVEISSPPAYLPILTLPPVIIPAIVIPTYNIPEVILPCQDMYEIGTGFGEIVVTGNEIIVSGATCVEGVLPTYGEVKFGGYVPAKGSVTICGFF